jgi:hypothetical protein
LKPILHRDENIWITVVIDREYLGSIRILLPGLRHGKCAQPFKRSGLDDNLWLPPTDGII